MEDAVKMEAGQGQAQGHDGQVQGNWRALLLRKVVFQEQRIADLENKLVLERGKRLAAQSNCVQICKGLTDTVVDLVNGLIKKEEDCRCDGGPHNFAEKKFLAGKIPVALYILKEKIQRWCFGDEEHEMLKDLRKMLNIFMGWKRREEPKSPAGDSDDLGQPSDGDSSDDLQSSTMTAQSEYKCEVGKEDSTSEEFIVDPSAPASPGHSVEADSDSDDSDIIFLEEIPNETAPPPPVPPPVSMPTTTGTSKEAFVIPRIVSTYSVATVEPIIRGQFTTPSEYEQSDSEEEEDAGPKLLRFNVPCTVGIPLAKGRPPRQRNVAMKRTGAFVPTIEKEKTKEKCTEVRRSSRSIKPTPKVEQTPKAKVVHAVDPDYPKQCRCGYESTLVANVQSHVKLLTGGDGRYQDHDVQKDERSTKITGKPKMEKVPFKQPGFKNTRTSTAPEKVGRKDRDDHYLVDTPRAVKGYRCACGRISASKSNLTAHIRKQTNDYKFQCPLCAVSFLYYSEQKNHLKNVHKIVRDWSSFHGCSYCGEVLSSHQKLAQHRASAHSGVKDDMDLDY